MTTISKGDLYLPITARPPRVVVVGSINMDLVIRCPTLPVPGETKLATSAAELCGGKGANQAVAAARAGGSVTMIGCVGDDAFASRLVANLERERIETSSVTRIENCSSGVAIVAVEESGQNSIMVVPGANSRLTPAEIQRTSSIIRTADIVLVQLEVPHDTVAEVIAIAAAAGVRVILDPAPAPTQWPGVFGLAKNAGRDSLGKVLPGISLLCPNQSEASALTGMPVETVPHAEEAAKQLLSQGVGAVAVTLAEHGTLLVEQNQTQFIAPFPVQAVDTTAAGDAFAGALAIRWVESGSLSQAVQFASAAGALAVTLHGAQQAMHTKLQIEEFISHRIKT